MAEILTSGDALAEKFWRGWPQPPPGMVQCRACVGSFASKMSADAGASMFIDSMQFKVILSRCFPSGGDDGAPVSSRLT